ncbi:DUF2795 domain-containing protein [Corallococcus sp. ZKHCc1 1396]|uniref:DUF2795 domain-containing protein n=1 Tax=Corallococcus soli TaxID=2710757 RepID=A0ABR9PK72_9BACT|nr:MULTISPECIES: DUF2795 domain-containing protein [Corallococcus]MBE4748297.1 DUF2795 domain-containing protein [Corallococcus soli]MCY1033160.1 DUF2795 domain-containing protein [Corallococcus sp. BB11-1]
MAYGQAEDPARSITPHLDSVDYPATREDLVEAAEDSGAPVDIINVFKSLPQKEYMLREHVLRDLAEAERRFAMGGLKDDDGVNRDRSNIGRDRVEGAPEGQTRHP